MASTAPLRSTSIDDRSAARRHDDDAPAGDGAVHASFTFAPAFRVVDLPFGIVPSRSSVILDDEQLTVRFGPWVVTTPLANVASAEVTGPYNILRVIGGPRLSLRDKGLTFATTTDAGVCITFVEPVRGLDPTGRLITHPSLTVTVADPAALAELLQAVADHRIAAAARPAAAPLALVEIAHEADDELLGLSAAELRARAQERGLTGVSKLRKADLLELLQTSDLADPSA